jgi:hypothetical protein
MREVGHVCAGCTTADMVGNVDDVQSQSMANVTRLHCRTRFNARRGKSTFLSRPWPRTVQDGAMKIIDVLGTKRVVCHGRDWGEKLIHGAHITVWKHLWSADPVYGAVISV